MIRWSLCSSRHSRERRGDVQLQRSVSTKIPRVLDRNFYYLLRNVCVCVCVCVCTYMQHRDRDRDLERQCVWPG